MPASTDYSTDRVLGSSTNNYNAVFTTQKDNSSLSKTDFLKLLIAQMQNQDFNDPMDNTTMVTQMAQYANMQSMQDMTKYMQASYALNLVGKTATISHNTVSGSTDSITGVIERVVAGSSDYTCYINGKGYSISELTSVQNTASASSGSNSSNSSVSSGKNG